jgi:hypothetical protein
MSRAILYSFVTIFAISQAFVEKRELVCSKTKKITFDRGSHARGGTKTVIATRRA